jgi:signal peptidase
MSEKKQTRFLTSMKTHLASLFGKGARFFRLLNDRISALIKSTGSVWGIIVALWAASIYLLVNFFLPGKVSAEYFLYVYQPVLWISLALLAWLGWRFGLAERPKPALTLTLTAFLLAFGQIAALAIAGLLLGFGYSPYSHELSAVLRNLFYLVTLLVGLEMLRAYLVTRFKGSQSWISFVLVSLFLSILRIAPATFGQLDTLQSSIQVIGERLLPTLAQNMLATLLAMLGGPLPSIIYLGVPQLFEWLSPILPNPGWFVTAFIGTVIPAYGMVIVYNQFIAEPEEQVEAEQEGQAKIRETGEFTSWALVALFTLVLVGFSTGLFGVDPSLIGSGSMVPNLRVGDIVVAREVPIETVRTGDVITFYQDGITIVHRVIDIQNDAGKIIFTTKGDANDSADPLVLEEFYKGKVIFTIPKIGWISIYVRNTLVKVL